MRQLCKGNVAVIKGAVLAGCRAYYGYPITPASEVAEAAALYLRKSAERSSRPRAKPHPSTWSTAPPLRECGS
jgi:pyruvate/2-oxoacid:ferredoxin oxidoreductase alpha subunit